MGQLWKYFSSDDWRIFMSDYVEKEYNKHTKFYEDTRSLALFDDDICKALAAISSSEFDSNFNVLLKWLETPLPEFDGSTAMHILSIPEGMNWIREYIIRL